MKIVAIIPARGSSKRLPNKNITEIDGKPLIAYTIESAIESKRINKIVVSTDDKKIADVSRNYGILVIDRPVEYSTDSAPIEWALRHAVRYLEENEKYTADIIVLLQANVPIRKKGVIDKVIDKLIQTSADSVVTVYEVDQRPEWMKRLVDDDKIVALQKSAAIRMQDLPKLYLLDGAVSAIRKEVLMATEGKVGTHVYLGDDIRAVIQDKIYSIEVDVTSDILFAEVALKILNENGGINEKNQN